MQNSRCEMRCGVWRDSFVVFLQVPVILFVSWDARNTHNKERDTCPEVTILPPLLRPQPPGGRWAPDSTWWQILVIICLRLSPALGLRPIPYRGEEGIHKSLSVPQAIETIHLNPKKWEGRKLDLHFLFTSSCLYDLNTMLTLWVAAWRRWRSWGRGWRGPPGSQGWWAGWPTPAAPVMV